MYTRIYTLVIIPLTVRGCNPACDANAQCVYDGNGGYLCQCNRGYEGNGQYCREIGNHANTLYVASVKKDVDIRNKLLTY